VYRYIRGMVPLAADQRGSLVRRGQLLNYATFLYMVLEGGVALGAGIVAGSVALIGFGIDSVIELAAAVAAFWRLSVDLDGVRRERVERITLRVTGLCFLALAVYVGADAMRALVTHSAPAQSKIGIVLAAASVIVMPLLARAKRRVGLGLASGALVAEARQTEICAYLAATLLIGLLLNVVLSWWWADPVAAMVMVPLIAYEGYQGVRGHSVCADGCAPIPGTT
jgi:divalent metal cation (Fe/Co/Zn/Cd) transporter